MTYPYSSELMRFDEETHRYILTEKALILRGIDLRGRLAAVRASATEFIINGFLETVSDLIYGYIHEFASDTARQDMLIATLPEARNIIYRALLAQAIYVALVGDLSRSVDEREREKAIDITARRELDKTIPSLGFPITYAGRY